MSTELSCLAHFAQPAREARGHWTSWPLLSLACDQESVNLTGISFLQRRCGLNLEVSFDPSHGCWNDIKQMARQMNLMPLLLLFMVCWNMPHGCFADDGRHQQAREAVEELLRSRSPSQTPLFMEYCGQILADRGEAFRAGEGGICDRLWRELRDCSALRLAGYKVNMNRFLSTVDEGVRQAQSYTLKLLTYEFVAIEMGMLHNRSRKKLVFKESATNEGGDTTKASKLSVEAKALRAGCQNNLVLSLMVLGEPLNRLRLRCFPMVCQPAYRWHREQNASLRSSEASLTWLDQQLNHGHFLDHIYEILTTALTPTSLSWIGLSLPHADSPSMAGPELNVELDLAQTIGMSSLVLAGCRIKRNLPLLRGWPMSVVRMLGSEADAAIAMFRSDLAAYEALQAIATVTPGAQELLGRSCFQLVCVD